MPQLEKLELIRYLNILFNLHGIDNKTYFKLTGVTQESATKNDTVITIPVNISRLM